MSRRSLIICLSALFVLLAGLGTAIAVLYRGTGGKSDESVSFDGPRRCFSAVPSDAVLVSCFSHASDACGGILSCFSTPAAIADGIKDGTLGHLRKCPMAVSLHYSDLTALYVFDVGRASGDGTFVPDGSSCGMYVQQCGDFLLMSSSKALVGSAVRHLSEGVSVSDTPGFADAVSSLSGDDLMIVSNLHMRKLMGSLAASPLMKHSSFAERTARWCAFETRSIPQNPVSLDGFLLYGGDTGEFATVLEDCEPSVSRVAGVLPSYTMSVVSLPVLNTEEYVSAYKDFIDSFQRLHHFTAMQDTLGKDYGIMPEDLFALLDVSEVASASFRMAGGEEKINLFHTGSRDAALIFKGNDVESLRGYSPAVHKWAYPKAAASVFGKLFALPDESCFTYLDGWIVTGSMKAIEEYVKGDILDYTLGDFLSDAGKENLLSERELLAMAYFSVSEERDRLGAYLKAPLRDPASALADRGQVVPLVLTLGRDKEKTSISLDIYSLELQKTKAPSQERDTVVVVPSGPFSVKNSHTGKMNTFYQNSSNAICLRDENGKDLWGVPLGKPLCGTASNIDYYANGKLQIIFGAGSSVYVIDRLGRYVSGFPLDLGREILVGPALYDFSGNHRYNIMVLHKDNTIQMYNLKGRKPDAWKGISLTDETIKALPERLTVSGKDFWVVRTSIQTLIYPFYGGEPLTVFEGDSKIRPDSDIRIGDGMQVGFQCYDGKTRTLKLN